MTIKYRNNLIVALLIFWSATIITGCDNIPEMTIDTATTPTLLMDTFAMKSTQNGNLSYRVAGDEMKRFQTPDSSYMRLDKGIYVESFDDSTMVVTSTLKGDRAYFNETIGRWKVMGNVVGRNIADGKTLSTEELYWDQKTREIFSVVYSRIDNGDQILVGFEGFKSNEDLSNIRIINSVGRMPFDTTATVVPADTLSVDSTLSELPTI